MNKDWIIFSLVRLSKDSIESYDMRSQGGVDEEKVEWMIKLTTKTGRIIWLKTIGAMGKGIVLEEMNRLDHEILGLPRPK